jgi:hypothetical protein
MRHQANLGMVGHIWLEDPRKSMIFAAMFDDTGGHAFHHLSSRWLQRCDIQGSMAEGSVHNMIGNGME